MGTEMTGGRCVIVGGGEMLDYPSAAGELRPGDFIICADSGYRHCEHLGIIPHLLVGDFDSIGAIPDGIPRETVPAEKDFSDTALAVERAVERGFGCVLAMGMGGGRPDHSIGNLQTLVHCARRGLGVEATDGVSRWVIAHTERGGALRLDPLPDHYFSVFAYSPTCRNVRISGAKYELVGRDLYHDEALGVSNEFVGVPAVIAWESGTLLVITTPKGR